MTDVVLIRAIVDSVKFAKSANPDPTLLNERCRSFVAALAGILESEGNYRSTRYAVLSRDVGALIRLEDDQ